jgi:2-isopropylmalate synthase
VQYIEGGTPGSNPKDVEYFQKVRDLSLHNAKIAAFGLTRRAGANVEEDNNIQALLESQAEIITLVAKSSDIQVTQVLETSLEENLSMIFDSVSYLKKHGRTVFLDAEHFFDGYRSNPDYAMRCLSVAADAGADSLELCDTNGGALPSEIEMAIAEISEKIHSPLGIHCHDDADLAVANTLVAVAAGVSNVQGSINGYGERCGNANLLSIIANLKLKYNIDCVSDEQLGSLTDVSHYVSEVVNIPPDSSQPYVGASAFSHKGGLHASAVAKMEDSYQHISPSKVGNEKKVLISELSGRSNLQYRIKELGLEKQVSTGQVSDLLF